MQKENLIKEEILQPCDCLQCVYYYDGSNTSLVYKIVNSKFRVRQVLGFASYWIGCPRNIDSYPSSFEEVFEGLDDDDKLKILYNLNNFK